MKKPKLGLFSKIKNAEDARLMTRDAAFAFYFVALLQGAVGFFMFPTLVIDAFMILVFAFFLHKFKSRIASVLLLLFSGAVVFSTFQNKFGGEQVGGNNILLALIMVVVAVRAVEGAFKYNKYKQAP